MSTFRIYQVHTEPSGEHEHITKVAISEDGSVSLRVETVATNIRNPDGDRYITYGGGELADVLVRTCPRCTFRDYITTHPDSTTKNNLLSLPRF